MTFNWWAWLGLIVNYITMVITSAFLILILGLGRRYRGNLPFALFLCLVLGWVGSGQLTQVLLWLGEGDPALTLQTSGIFFFLQSVALFYFAGRLVGLRHNWLNLSAVAGLVIWLIGWIPQGNHQVVANPRLSPDALILWDAGPLGYTLLGASLAYLLAALVLVGARRPKLSHPALMTGTGVMVVGEIAGLSAALYISPMPVLSLAFAVGVAILGWSMIYVQLFRPLSDRVRGLQRRRVDLEEYSPLAEADCVSYNVDEWRERMSQMIVHDLKGPLGIIEVVLNEFRESPLAPFDGALHGFLESALVATHRAQQIIYSMLEVGRLEAGYLPITQALVNPATLVAECVREISPSLAYHGVRIHVDLPAQVRQVRVDPAVTARVMGNLLDNAIKFSPLNGMITVCVRPGPDEVEISVADEGYGVPPVYQQLIFERFFQFTSQGRSIRSGVGLGLTFCKLAIEAQGGRIWVESDGCHGSTFYFTLPVWKEPVYVGT